MNVGGSALGSLRSFGRTKIFLNLQIPPQALSEEKTFTILAKPFYKLMDRLDGLTNGMWMVGGNMQMILRMAILYAKYTPVVLILCVDASGFGNCWLQRTSKP